MIDDRSLNLFQNVAKNIPAYKQFLKSRSFTPSQVTGVDEFKQVPLTDKSSYLRAYPLQDLIWQGDDAKTLLFCSTSGSTGEPYYFPRNEKLSWQYSFILEEFIKNSSYGSGSTLVLIGFGMGVWIGGVITLRAFEIAGQRLDSQLSILPTGYNKVEIFKALRNLSPDYDQTVIVGYPPFIKELIDEAESESVKLDKLNIRFLFAAEAFTETFRNYVCDKAGIQNPLLDTLNIYGTADIGAMAYETPLSILIRRLTLEDPLLFRDVFGQIEKTPTLAQYNPEFIQFEAVNGEILLTGDGALPLIRYKVGDNGGVFDYSTIRRILRNYNIDLDAEMLKAGIHSPKHPFVFVYERTDLSATLHGINIYPEFIKDTLLEPKLSPYFTERFTMMTKHDIYHNQFLQVNLEMQKGVEISDKLNDIALKHIRTGMIKKSSEFSEISKSPASEKLIQVIAWENGHPRYFAPGTKQKWIQKP